MSMIFEDGFKRLQEATFAPAMMADTIKKMALEAVEMSAESMEMTLHYNSGAVSGQMVPEIVLRAVKYDPDRHGDDDDDDYDDE